uniref:CAP domain-containing protein n=1 Tax=uncultured Sphingomonas sp. TaxID=158754 RepID=UPI0025E3BAE4|nr:CAP domain-containing protein [uncultured Sphingomonas sp.]
MLNSMMVVAAIVAAAGASPTLRLEARPGLSAVEQRLLAAHNVERRRVGAAPLTWDPALAASAASYGPALASLGRLAHSPRASRPGQRENLWMGPRGVHSPEQMVGRWIDERALLRPGVYPLVSSTGRWEDVSHYTQLVWPSTTRVGCAVHSGAATDYLICRYSPPGNRDGFPIPTAWLR